jgi:outer membrane protein assembly factor BamB
VIPTLPGCKYKYLGIQANKGSQVWFINMENLSNGPNPFGNPVGIGAKLTVPMGGLIYAGPTVWTNPADNTVWAYVGSENGMAAVQMGVDANGLPTMTNKWSQKTSFTTTPFIANGVLYATDGGGQLRFWNGDNHGIKKIYAMNPTTGNILWSDTISFHHWSCPIVVNGVLYIGDGMTGEQGQSQSHTGALKAYSLGGVVSSLGSVEIPGVSMRMLPGRIAVNMPASRAKSEVSLLSLDGKILLQRSLGGESSFEIPLSANLHGALIFRLKRGMGEYIKRIHIDRGS